MCFVLRSFKLRRADITLDPDDGKPMEITFMSDGSFNGKAGNNDIQGNYRLGNNDLIFTIFSTEIVNTEWESLFNQILGKSYDNKEYIMP